MHFSDFRVGQTSLFSKYVLYPQMNTDNKDRLIELRQNLRVLHFLFTDLVYWDIYGVLSLRPVHDMVIVYKFHRHLPASEMMNGRKVWQVLRVFVPNPLFWLRITAQALVMEVSIIRIIKTKMTKQSPHPHMFFNLLQAVDDGTAASGITWSNNPEERG